MSSSGVRDGGERETGGYFGLELASLGRSPHAAALALNSARNAFLYVLRAFRPARVHLPAYLCSSMAEPLVRERIEVRRYNVNEVLEIAGEVAVEPGELLLYVNYFGIKGRYCRELASRLGQALIVDNSQAFFTPPLDCAANLYSPRKFFGVADGGFLYTSGRLEESLATDVSYDAVLHLAGRVDQNAADFYQDYRRSEQRLSGRPLRIMSRLTRAILDGVDYERVRLARERNFLFLHAALRSMNLLQADTEDLCGPMVYPLLTDDLGLRQRLLARRVYVATYWKEILGTEEASPLEKRLATNLVPLPVDQRYGLDEMRSILDIVRGTACES